MGSELARRFVENGEEHQSCLRTCSGRAHSWQAAPRARMQNSLLPEHALRTERTARRAIRFASGR
jgi:hypothetical protein